jgi:hypothetical protein
MVQFSIIHNQRKFKSILAPHEITVVFGSKGQFHKIFDPCFFINPAHLIKGIVSRDFIVCFLVSFDRSDISTQQEWVLLLLKVRFCIKFFYFRVLA